MTDKPELLKIAEKWQKKWEEAAIFEANPDKREKFFVNFPYPYINAYQHIGHLFTLMRVEALARYKRLKGFNVLFPQGWHATGSPIVNAAKRVASKEEKQIKIMKDMGFSEQDIKKFEKPEYWIEFFAPEFEKDYRSIGMSVDWRRKFHTTSLNPYYDKFVRWQFRKLKEKNYVIKGRFPVIWDPVESVAVGDHARMEGEGVTTQDFIWGKFKLNDSDLILMAGTTRPDAFYGQTHLWIDPEGDYVIVKVKDEKWVTGREALSKIHNQYDKDAKIIGDITPKELMGKWTRGPLVDYDTYIVPAWFIDSAVGSGIVYSALEDPVDLFELKKIHSDMSMLDEYNLDKDVVAKLKPIPIISVPGMGDNLGEDIGKEFGIKSPDEKRKVEEAKGELNRRVFRKGVMKNNCGDCSGMTVPQAQEWLKENLPKRNEAVMFYEMTGKVVSRGLNECVVKIVDDQWFINYKDKGWKELAHKCLNKMNLYPEKARRQFEYVIDWLHEWACTRKEGLGTKLPWDEKWLIESLSDSTVYMAYYTIVHLLTNIPIDKVDDNLFDYIFLGKGDKPKIEKVDELKKNFDYYYPVDFRNSGKDLIQNHLTFFIFSHVAIFDEKNWPKGIGANGWVTVDGRKMSKSLGNMIPVRTVVKEYGPDVARLTILNGGEEMDDPNWDSEFAKSMCSKLVMLKSFCAEYYNKKGRNEENQIDSWFESELNMVIRDATKTMEKTLFRTAIQKIYFNMHNIVRQYIKRSNNNINSTLMKKYIEAQLIMLTPFTPHLCEEAWAEIGKKSFISEAKWPECDESKIDEDLSLMSEYIEQVFSDIRRVKELAKLEKLSNIKIFVADDWKYDFFNIVGKELADNNRDFKLILGKIMNNEKLKVQGKVITKILPNLLKKGVSKINKEQEIEILNESIESLKKEFNAEIEIILEGASSEQKAKQAMPGKPSLIVE